jgi:hypothetical protein
VNDSRLGSAFKLTASAPKIRFRTGLCVLSIDTKEMFCSAVELPDHYPNDLVAVLSSQGPKIGSSQIQGPFIMERRGIGILNNSFCKRDKRETA